MGALVGAAVGLAEDRVDPLRTDGRGIVEAKGDGGIDAGGPEDDGKPGKDKPGGGKGRGDGKLRLLRADASPSKAYFGGRSATFRFVIAGRRKRDVVVQVKRKGGKPAIVRRFVVKNVRPGTARSVRWNGRVDGSKKYARQGYYKFKVRAKRGGAADVKNAAGKPKAGFFNHKFPVRGAHTYGDGLGAGRGHRGADVFANCGTKLQAARAGRIQHKAFQGSGAGHYVVIDGKGNGKDYVYMHLVHASPRASGERVRTGQKIGLVGETGNASGCHLHFEIWSAPGWYQGGTFLDPLPKLQAWDGWS